ncbi:SusC/RagA family TonB-linked outer membrane protein [Flavobacterium sp. NG2]|uniref:SusC/RagA family TonB-linked outer membrane protein n=1 Tax=Flavobacterium sp. NG2 TaxID=3097547 RepID=UPI002A82ABF7|nr:SusC/RagA family TonB-linked outer membrane protein [Flavobacterium sp. NG2]WPR70105.1 SusC/RagA family TonB-linked outer membrane protein [Flavobacterium sp. NG2]
MLKLIMKQKTKKKGSFLGLGLMLMLFFSISAFNLHAQDRISGVVKDETGFPLPGVNVVQKGTKKGVITDAQGKFSVQVTAGAKALLFTYIGFQAKEVAIGGSKTINVTLKESAEALEDVVIIGYQKVQREKVLGSITSVKAESIVQSAPIDVLQGVQGKVAGVQILSNNGPGEGFDIRIRGIGSINGSTSPLYVVDGQQTFNIDNLNASDIESFEILKDGATTAPYGAQGANGVVVITTKSGKKGDLKVDVTTITGANSLVGAVPVANAKQRVFMERVLDAGNTSLTRLDSLNLGYRQSPDNQKLITRTGFRYQTNVSLSGGGDKSKFYWNTGYLKQDGVVLNSDFKRISTRLKLDLTPTKKFSAGTVINMTFEETNGISSGAVLGNSLNRIPYITVYEPNGDLSPTPTNFNGSANPVQQLLLRKQNKRAYKFNIFNYAEYKILPQLTLKSTLGLNMSYTKEEMYAPKALLVGGGTTADSRSTAAERHALEYNVQQDNFLNFNQKWNKHSLSAFGGMQVQALRYEILGIDTALSNDLITTLNNSNLDFLTANRFSSSNALKDQTQNYDQGQFSLFTGFNYDFDSKYLVGATMRRDGSSKFGPSNKYGYFPSGSLGWRANKENFLKNVSTIDNLLIRASYGIVGNDRIRDFQYEDQLSPSGLYNGVLGVVPTVVGNSTIKWESTASSNIGLDLGMFKRRLNFSVDAWLKDTKDLLVETRLPQESGFSVIQENRGNIRNKGLDLSINGAIIKNKIFTWDAGFNIGFLENKVTKLNSPIINGVSRIVEGQPIGNFIGYKQNGIYQYDESNAYDPTSGARLYPNFDANGFFLGNYNTAAGQAYNGPIRQLVHETSGNVLKGGDYIWEDTNNDGKINTADTQILGNGIATTYGGLTQDFKYKNFTLGLLFDYSFGNEIYKRYDHNRNSFRATTITPAPDRIEQAWTQQGDIATYPIIAAGNNNGRPQNSFDYTADNTANSLYVEDGSFIKWRYIRMGYNFSKDAIKSFNIGLKAVSLNLQVNNILTWTNYSGYNPEFGSRDSVLQPSVDNLRYPSDREIILSLRVQF